MWSRMFLVHVAFFVPFLSAVVPSRALNIEMRSKVGIHYAAVTITYEDVETGRQRIEETNDDATYGTTASLNYVRGRLLQVRSKNNTTGCGDYDHELPLVKWIALIERGDCRFHDKIFKAAKQYNASAVVIYNDKPVDSIDRVHMKHSVEDVVNVFISKDFGEHLVQLLNAGNVITMEITYNSHNALRGITNLSKTSVLFVSISFIVLMIVSLAWLIFYYVQRFRYAHAKERLSRRLSSAAKKAISRIPQKMVKTGDKELAGDYDQCAVCIEVYKSSDVIRILPCKHVFHKSCVDPWLIEQRSCPMCKMDILRAFGLQLSISQESVTRQSSDGTAVAIAMVIDSEPLSTADNATVNSGGLDIVLITNPSIHQHQEDDVHIQQENPATPLCPVEEPSGLHTQASAEAMLMMTSNMEERRHLINSEITH